jgi:hypothetical protein
MIFHNHSLNFFNILTIIIRLDSSSDQNFNFENLVMPAGKSRVINFEYKTHTNKKFEQQKMEIE